MLLRPLSFLKISLRQCIINEPSGTWFIMTSLLKQKSFFDSFPPPDYLLLSSAGVAIADKGIKFIEFHRDLMSSKLRIKHSSRLILPPGVVESGTIRDTKALSAAL